MPMIRLDYHPPKPIFLRPKLLTHPRIPRAMAGINPRTILGDEWWETERRKAYAGNNHCCWACGAPAGGDLKYPALEAHESYKINYRKKIMRLDEVVALCWSCHKFIHSGLLEAMVARGQIPQDLALKVLDSRMAIVHEHKLKPYYYTRELQLTLQGKKPLEAKMTVAREKVTRPKAPRYGVSWKLILNGKEYYGGNDGLDDLY